MSRPAANGASIPSSFLSRFFLEFRPQAALQAKKFQPKAQKTGHQKAKIRGAFYRGRDGTIPQATKGPLRPKFGHRNTTQNVNLWGTPACPSAPQKAPRAKRVQKPSPLIRIQSYPDSKPRNLVYSKPDCFTKRSRPHFCFGLTLWCSIHALKKIA